MHICHMHLRHAHVTCDMYILALQVHISGAFPRKRWGPPRCRFGTCPDCWVGGTGQHINETHASCRKPRFPDSQRDLVGAYDFSFAINGQCFPPSTATFHTYNSQVSRLAITGAPFSTSISLPIEGDGFVVPGLTGGLCRFVETTSNTSVETALQVLSPTSALCPTPAQYRVARYTVEVLQNGLTADPFLDGDAPIFTAYDLAAVRVSALNPQGGLVATETTITLLGSGFASYGQGQLNCEAGDTLVPGTLLDERNLVCAMPVSSAAATVAISVSLSGGAAGTFSNDTMSFVHYPAPFIDAVSPQNGSAMGGEMITVVGLGFTALASTLQGLSTPQGRRLDAHDGNGSQDSREYVRCRFGSAVQTKPPSSVSDSQVSCEETISIEGRNQTPAQQTCLL